MLITPEAIINYFASFCRHTLKAVSHSIQTQPKERLLCRTDKTNLSTL